MERKLASIQRIDDLQPISGADQIEVAGVLGWKVVVRKGEFKIGDLCVYCEIDSVLPPKPEFEFLAGKKYRVRTIKLKGQVSQGIAFPLLGAGFTSGDTFYLGLDVTEKMGVTKWELPEVNSNNPPGYKQTKRVGSSFPNYVPKTDEMRLQTIPDVLDELATIPCFVTQKIDGTSGTFAIKDGKIDVCSRTISRPDPLHSTLWQKMCEWFLRGRRKKKNIPASCVYWDIARKYNIPEILKNYIHNIAIQGEIAGPNIQGNKLGLKEQELFVFNVYDIDEKRYFTYEELMEFCSLNDLVTVPVLQENVLFKDMTIDKFLELAEGKYPNGSPQEGIVIRSMNEVYSHTLKGRLSFKVISNTFLLKEKD
jgi:RNA ligase (TIGR02306 family)